MRRTTTLLAASAVALAGYIGSASAADEEKTSTKSFTVLAGVKATAMAANELDAVKGAHVHFLDPSGGFHLAGNPENKGVGIGNWYDNGSPEAEAGHLVAPSYHGLCVAAAGPSGILVPATGPGGVPTLPQCP
jgi:hypothetical protein